jgi:hypothetical protein
MLCQDLEDGKLYKWNAFTAALEEVAATGSFTFLAASDTPATSVGQGGKFVKVNVGETAVEFTASTVAGHSILSSSHTDSTTGTVVRGDLIIGQGASPTWTRLGKGSSGAVLVSNATDALWSTYLFSGTAAQTYTFPTTTATLARTDAGQTFTGVQAFTAPTVATSITPNTFANASLGTSLLPFSSVFIGDAATNNIQLINTDATSAKVATFPDVTGTVMVGATSTTTTQALFATATAGAPAFRAIADGDLPATIKGLTLTAAADGFTVTGGTTPRTLTVQTGAVTLTGNSAGSTLVLPSGSLTLGTMAAETATSYVANALYDAYSVIYADTDNTPVALTVGASTIVGRKASGGIVALTGAEGLVIVGGQASDGDLTAIAALSVAQGKIIIGSASPAWSLSAYALPILDGTTDYVLKTNGAGVVAWAADETGGTTNINNLGDASGDGAVDLVTYKQAWTSQLNSAGAVLSVTDSVADLTADVSLFDFVFKDSDDANAFAWRLYDSDDTGTILAKLSGAGVLTAAGFSGPLTGAVTGNASTATALAADPANCSAGQIALGVTAAGVAECTATPSGLTSVGATTFTGALTGNADTATLAATVTVVDGSDATSYVAIFDSASGSLAVKTDTGITYAADTGILTATGFAGPLTGNASTATLAATSTIIDGTDASSFVVIVDSATGSLALKTDTGITYAADTGILTATGFAGPLTGAVTGNASTSTALFANGSNCSSGSFPLGVDASGASESCTDAATQAELDAWVGSANVTTLGTIASGVWDATTILANAGGTGFQTYVVGDILYADTTTTLAKLAATTAGYILTSGGVGTAPLWATPGAATSHSLLDGAVHPDSLADVVTLGDIIHGNATPKWASLAGNTTTTKKYLTQTGTGAASAVPVWDTIAAADLPAALTSIAALTETNGGIPYGTADNTYAWLAAGAAGKLLRGAGAAAPTWSTSTFADTYDIGTILHASSANTVAGLAAGTTGQILRGVTGAAPAWTTVTFPATVAIGSVLVANTANIMTALTSASGTYYLQNAEGVLSWGTPAGAGDVTAVGDCASGLCGDGTSDGGTYIELYNASGNTRIVNTAGVLEAKTAAGAAYASFKAADITTVAVDGSNKIVVSNNTAITGGIENAIFPEANIWKVTQGGGSTEYTLPIGPSAGQITFTGPSAAHTYALPNADATILTNNAAVTVGQGGTGLTTGTSGGVPYFNATNTMASSAALAQYNIVLGGGAGAAPVTLGSMGTTTQVLHGNAIGAPSFAAVTYSDITAMSSASFATLISDEQGTGVVVFSDSPTFVDDITVAAAGVKFTGANGVLTILGLGDGYDENLTIDFNTSTNVVTFNSGTLATFTVTPATTFTAAVTAASFTSTGADGTNRLVITNNTAIAPTGSAMEIYPEANVWKMNTNGVESTIMSTTGSPAAMVIASQATGDLLYASSASVWARLGIQAAGYVLAGGAAPGWDDSPQITTIELGAAADTTIARVSAGIISVEGAQVTTLGATIGASEVDADVATQAEIDLKANITSPAFLISMALPVDGTVDAAGETTVDTTSDQLRYYGGAARSIPYKKTYSVVVPSVADTDDVMFVKLPYGLTALVLDCIVSAATSATINIVECNGTGTCTDEMATADLVCDVDGATTSTFGGAAGAAADSGDWLQLKVESISGTPGTLTVTLTYSVVAD